MRHSLAWVASPVTVLATVVLALNDHVLKQAYPGLVTGKLSDVAGLIVAPALLAVAVAALRVRRSSVIAVVATGIGFSLVKTWQPATDLANAWWDPTGMFPTNILRDPTDLLALPALFVALVAARRAARPASLRSRARLAAGAFVLPLAVLTTAATSYDCGAPEGQTTLALVRGAFTGGAGTDETRILVWQEGVTLDAAGNWQELSDDDHLRFSNRGDTYAEIGEHRVERACALVTEQQACWRIEGDHRIQHFVDAAWRDDYVMPTDLVRDLHEQFDEKCGAANVRINDLAVMPTGDGPVVVAAAGVAGILVRDQDGNWERNPPEMATPSAAPASHLPVPTEPLRLRDPAPPEYTEQPTAALDTDPVQPQPLPEYRTDPLLPPGTTVVDRFATSLSADAVERTYLIVTDDDPGLGPYANRWQQHLESRGAHSNTEPGELPARAFPDDLALLLYDPRTFCDTVPPWLCRAITERVRSADTYVVTIEDRSR